MVRPSGEGRVHRRAEDDHRAVDLRVAGGGDQQPAEHARVGRDRVENVRLLRPDDEPGGGDRADGGAADPTRAQTRVGKRAGAPGGATGGVPGRVPPGPWRRGSGVGGAPGGLPAVHQRSGRGEHRPDGTGVGVPADEVHRGPRGGRDLPAGHRPVDPVEPGRGDGEHAVARDHFLRDPDGPGVHCAGGPRGR